MVIALHDHLETSLPAAPARLVEDGKFNLGVYGSAFQQVNFADARFAPGTPRWGVLRARRLVEFQHFAIGNGRFHVSVALFDTKRIGQAQVSIYDRATRTKYRHERKAMPWELRLPETVLDGEAAFRRGGFHITFQNGLARGEHTLAFRCPAARGLPEVAGEFRCPEVPETGPVVVCLPFTDTANGPAMYSHKAILPAEGRLRIGGEPHDFPLAASYTMTDIHKGYYPNPLRWNWAAGAGFLPDGRRFGFNLTRNAARNPDTYNENWIWLQDSADPAALRGTAHRFTAVDFSFRDSNALGEPWRVRDAAGRVDVAFTPEVAHSIDLNAGFMHSRYRGPYGTFQGRLSLPNGEAIDLSPAFGMAEDFYLRG